MSNKIKNPTTNQTIHINSKGGATAIKSSNYSHGKMSNVPIGTIFPKRIDALKAKVHGMSQAGIHSRKGQPAYSIVLNDGYIDDEDFGDIIIYTGEGGNDNITKHQIRDQTLTKGNLALTLNIKNDIPVRVLRGPKHNSALPKPKGYRYDGLFYVVDSWEEINSDGFLIYRYKLMNDAAINDIDYAPVPGETILLKHK